MSFPLQLTRPITCVDLETTSSNPREARIVEIAIIQIQPDGNRTEWWSLINPGVSIPKGASDIHGILDEHVLGKPRFEDVAGKLVRAFRGCDVCGYNVRYDMDVLKFEFERAGVSTEVPPGVKPPRVLDGFRLWQLAEPRSLTDFIRRWSGRDHDGAHGATADITGTIDGIVDLLKQTPSLPADLDQLHELQFPRDPNAIDAAGKVRFNERGVACLSFGKHAGKPLAEVPRDYLRWMLDKTEMAFDLRAIITAATQGNYPTRA